MDIAFVTTRLVDRDAQGNFSAATLAALKKRCGGRVMLYTFAFERPPIDGVEVRFPGGENRHGIGTNVRALLNSFTIARELAACDRLVLAGPDVGVLPAVHLAKRRNPGLKLVWVYHGHTPPEHLSGAKEQMLARLRKWAYLRSMKRSDMVKTDSLYTRDELIGEGIDPSRVVAVPIGIDLSRFSPGDGTEARSALGAGDRFLLLYVGRLATGKRVDILLRAMAALKGEPVMLAVVGDGPERERLESLASDLGLNDTVKFAGRVPDAQLPGYYRACDVWVTASEHEGFCVPVVEAMATGKPVIVPEVTAMPETAGTAGLLYRPGDAGGLVRHIQKLMIDRTLYGMLVERARAEAPKYDIASVMAPYVDMLLDAGGTK